MSRAELLTLVVMIVGVVGTVVPVLPGLLLVWAAGVAWAWWDGGGVARFAVAGVLTALLVLATVLKYAVPARSVRDTGAPRRTVWLAALGAVVGFFVVPVVGLVLGAVVAVWLAEFHRLGERGAAWRSTWVVLRGIGIGVLIELTGAVVMLAVWLVAVLLT